MTNRLTNKMVRRAALAAAALLTAGTLLAACQKSEKKPEDNAQTAPAPATGGEQQPGSAGQTPPAGQGGTGTAPGGTAAQPNEPVKLTPLSYLEEEKKFIRETANKLGVKTVYLPQQGAPDDRLSQVQGMEKAFALVFFEDANCRIGSRNQTGGQARIGTGGQAQHRHGQMGHRRRAAYALLEARRYVFGAKLGKIRLAARN